MQVAPRTSNERARLAALYDAAILDTPDENEFDQVVRLAAETCDTPIALVTLIDEKRQWFKARQGIEDKETHRDLSVCAHAILGRGPFVVRDATLDARFSDNPLVTGAPHVRFYAGIPLLTSDGFAVGSLCVMGTEARELSEREERALLVLAKHVANLIDLRRAANNTHRLLSELRERSSTQERITHTATRLLTVVAHDVRGPLASIISALDFNDADLTPLREVVKAQAILARDLLDQILAWARTMMRGGPTVEYNVDMVHIVNEVIQGASLAASQKNTLLHADVQIPNCDTDPNLIRFILHSLVTNAVKYTSEGEVTIRLHKHDKGASLEVVDNGLGMSPETLRRLFDWGSRSVSVGTHQEKGAGLALLLVKDFCDLLGWTIRIESQLNKGTRVVVTCSELPIFATS